MKKLELKLDDLAVDTFETLPAGAAPRGTVVGNDGETTETNDAYCWAGTHGGNTCDTTCHQIICGCSMGPSDCDYTCPGYEHADYFSCYDNCP